MATLVPWTTVEIGDLDIFSPMLPSLVVYTWYVDDKPESSITYFWRDEDTGAINHELILVAPVTFEDAVARAHEEAPKRSVDRIHVKHARSNKLVGKAKPKGSAKATPSKPSKKRTPVKAATAAARSVRHKRPA
jgi:hypothetical protein